MDYLLVGSCQRIDELRADRCVQRYRTVDAFTEMQSAGVEVGLPLSDAMTI